MLVVEVVVEVVVSGFVPGVSRFPGLLPGKFGFEVVDCGLDVTI